METILDIIAVIIFLLVVSSVTWAVRSEAEEVSGPLTALVALFAVIFGLVFMAAASQLATSALSTQLCLLVFMVVVAILGRAVWSSKPAH